MIFNKNQVEIFNFINKFHFNHPINHQKIFGYWEEPILMMDMLNYLKKRDENSDNFTSYVDYKLTKFMGKLIQKEFE